VFPGHVGGAPDDLPERLSPERLDLPSRAHAASAWTCWTAARIELGKAYERVGARVPVLSDEYALAAIQSGEEQLAEKVLVDAIGWNPDYPALHVHLARLLVQRQDWAGAKEHLLLANRRDPFDPEIHAGLSRALAALDDPQGASREERFSRILEPEAAHP